MASKDIAANSTVSTRSRMDARRYMRVNQMYRIHLPERLTGIIPMPMIPMKRESMRMNRHACQQARPNTVQLTTARNHFSMVIGSEPEEFAGRPRHEPRA